MVQEICMLVFAIWFLLAAWLRLVFFSNESYWIMTTIYFLTLNTASINCIYVFYRRRAKKETPQTSMISERASRMIDPEEYMEEMDKQFHASSRNLNNLTN